MLLEEADATRGMARQPATGQSQGTFEPATGSPRTGSIPVHANSSHSSNHNVIRSNAKIIHGTPGDDIIIGGSADQKIYGGGGNDVIIGAGGLDRIFGGSGNRGARLEAGVCVESAHGARDPRSCATRGSSARRIAAAAELAGVDQGEDLELGTIAPWSAWPARDGQCFPRTYAAAWSRTIAIRLPMNRLASISCRPQSARTWPPTKTSPGMSDVRAEPGSPCTATAR